MVSLNTQKCWALFIFSRFKISCFFCMFKFLVLSKLLICPVFHLLVCMCINFQRFCKKNSVINIFCKNKNPLNSFNEKFRNIIKLISKTIETLGGNPRSLKHINPQFPKLYGQPKIHKSNIPIRPVVAFNQSTIYNCAKWMNYIKKYHKLQN